MVVQPLLYGSAKSRLLLPDVPSSKLFHHLRTRSGALYNVFEIVPGTVDEQSGQSIDEPVVYAGPLFNHFGHLIAESIHRLWPRLTSPEFRNLKVAFHPTPTKRGYHTSIPSWMAAVLSYMDVEPEDIVYIDRPTYFRRLFIPEQARGQTFKCADPNYKDIFPLNIISRTNSSAKQSNKLIYVSRSRYLHAGSYLGEQLVESVLRQAGFLVIYPEDWNVKDVVELFCGASAIVFSEGSAIHILELCGHVTASVYIICRRSRSFVRNVFGGLLEEFVPNFHLIENLELVTPLDWNESKKTPTAGKACAIVDIALLLKGLSRSLSIDIFIPSKYTIVQAQRSDLLRLILDERSTGTTTDSRRLGELLSLLRVQFRDHQLLDSLLDPASLGLPGERTSSATSIADP